MTPVLGNPAGLWALVGVPLVLAIHFLQQRSRRVVVSTWFLIAPLAPESVGGPTWEKLRHSRQLWLQLAAVVLTAWLLAAPRWPRAESAQTVVLVLDASAAMEAFRDAARTEAEREMALAEGLAARTTWVVLTTDPRAKPLYRGTDRAAALAALPDWRPELGTHDFAPALQLARTLAGETGRTLLITSAKTQVPPGQRAAGVGRPLQNAGFAGASVTKDGAGHTWRALVRSHAAVEQTRTWALETAAGRSAPRSFKVAAGGVVELAGEFPAGADRVTLVLDPDAFASDDQLPLVRPQPKPLAVSIGGAAGEPALDFFRKVAAEVDGVSVSALPGGDLRIARVDAAAAGGEARGGILLPPAQAQREVTLAVEPVTPEHHPLVDGLNWQGWTGPAPAGFTRGENDTVLLWQGGVPLALLHRTPPGARQLRLAIDWERTNASRLPATVLLARRFLEEERDAKARPFAANFDCGAPLVPAAGLDGGGLAIEFEPARGGAPEREVTGSSAPRVPGRPGFFRVRRGEEVLVRGAAQWADSRQGDFRRAETFFQDNPTQRQAALERLTRPDPLATLWLLAAAACALGSWWVPTRKDAA
jgi:hypothetical protein